MIKIDKKRIEGSLGDSFRVEVFDELDSTNAEAKRRIRSGLRDPALLIAEKQTEGRGRLGRSFYSPENTGIYMTLVWPAEEGEEDFLRVTAKTSVAVLKGLQRTVNAALSIKWVNDIYFGKKKICGILAESLSVPDENNFWRMWLVIGIGINVSTKDFPEELREKAGSLGANPENCDRNGLILDIMDELLRELRNPKDLSYLETYRNRSNILGKKVLYGTAPDFREGIAAEIDDTGALLIETPEGIRERLYTGEISVKTEE